ncbi:MULTISPECIES: SRPBCC family protein [Pseudomonas]|uniref:SRPBCC family protein n=1 Tax=Pseudomonas TaxID=286 RepID=UPI0005A62F9F|nr:MULTISPECIES: SRPBCC family protein [Pseudomonas]AZD93898.1 Aha1 domain superfamily [Pseudomonas chlororaphis subsp. aureofaciens]AZE18487.1 Aha1 domain superfamily [Pseudomonas chlororaphis subsp. aureofaciens]KAB0534224.1 vanillate O-demethylase oxidoreductase VanB [Pseudomonas chlororaphis subsp. aureofaciens]POA64779.1 vanillate O-demethylase oxidoreductase VanB [Pseudomonas sp. GW531-T4]TSD28020.1 vanillate O-demethylase oxidoreductase VanB [Pseudomonas sp. ATCC 13985]
MNSSDRIERKILLKATRSRVWAALADAEAFGSWFGVALAGQRFVVGQRTRGQITYPGYEHLVWDVLVERLEPEHLFAFSWHPYAVESGVDYSVEPSTLVQFELEDLDGGTLLRVVESGFDGIPPERRLKAFRMNSRGWDEQMNNIETYLGP